MGHQAPDNAPTLSVPTPLVPPCPQSDVLMLPVPRTLRGRGRLSTRCSMGMCNMLPRLSALWEIDTLYRDHPNQSPHNESIEIRVSSSNDPSTRPITDKIGQRND